jgi:hypothetical protein
MTSQRNVQVDGNWAGVFLNTFMTATERVEEGGCVAVSTDTGTFTHPFLELMKTEIRSLRSTFNGHLQHSSRFSINKCVFKD